MIDVFFCFFIVYLFHNLKLKVMEEKKLFEVNKGLIALSIPKEIMPSDDITLSVAGWKGIVNEKLKEAINGVLEVYSVGEGVSFVNVGDKIMIAGHVKPQQIELDVEYSRYPAVFLIIREHECIIKL